MRLILFFLLFTQFITAQNFEEVQKFVNNDRAANGLFGFNMSVSESTMVVTAPGLAVDRGAAYIFEKDASNNWVEVQKLVPNDVQVGDGFGLAGVYLNQNVLAITSENQDFDENGENELSSAGAVYIFEKNDNGNWEEIQKIVASDRDTEDIFGQSVYIDEDIVIVGAYFDRFDDEQGNELAGGSVYVFERDTNGDYQEIQKITASDAKQDAEFGITLDYRNNILIVGADRESEDENGTSQMPNAGAVYVFEKQSDNTFVEVQKMVPNDRSSGDAFGVLVKMSDSFIAISSSQEFSSQTGIVYTFAQEETGIFTQIQRIQPEELDTGDGFGIGAINEEYMVIGAVFEAQDESGSNPVSNAGAAFIYERTNATTWELSQKIVPEIREENDLFGSRTAISGNDVIVASLLEDEDENGNNTLLNAGAVYVFRDPTLNLNDESQLQAKIYPNPSHGEFTLSFTESPKSGSVTVSNMLGQTLVKKDFKNATMINLKIDATPGLYFIQYNTTDGAFGAFQHIKI